MERRISRKITLNSTISTNSHKKFLENFHKVFVNTVCNPFYTFNEEIKSRKFLDEVARLVSLSSLI